MASASIAIRMERFIEAIEGMINRKERGRRPGRMEQSIQAITRMGKKVVLANLYETTGAALLESSKIIVFMGKGNTCGRIKGAMTASGSLIK